MVKYTYTVGQHHTALILDTQKWKEPLVVTGICSLVCRGGFTWGEKKIGLCISMAIYNPLSSILLSRVGREVRKHTSCNLLPNLGDHFLTIHWF